MTTLLALSVCSHMPRVNSSPTAAPSCATLPTLNTLADMVSQETRCATRAMEEEFQVDLADLVPHPRYGTCPRVPVTWWRRCVRALAGSSNSSGAVTTECVRSWYGHQPEIVFPATSIPANTRKQNFSVVAREFYVDVLKSCRDCNRPFIFFAREQQYWYEELGFSIGADCVRCPQCRKSDRLMRHRFTRYSQRVTDNNIDDESLAVLLSDAVFLWNHQILKDEQKLRRLRNLGNERLPQRAEVTEINQLVSTLEFEGEA